MECAVFAGAVGGSGNDAVASAGNGALNALEPISSGSLSGANFQVGVESLPELIQELRFSLAHANEESGPGPPSIGDLEDDLCLLDNGDDDNLIIDSLICDDLSGLMAIQRVDSQDVVIDNRAKKAKILGTYVMGDVLGEGSYAKVKEAVDQNTLCRRAIKIMKRRKLRKIPNGEANVEREIRLVRQLKHPNIMSLIEVFYNDEKGKVYMVLEYCCAVLKDMLEKSPMKKFPVWQAHFYFCQLTEGMEYLHSNGIIHKDIKPGNLLLDTAGVLKIADFGVAEKLDLFAPNDFIRTSQGTPAFQPPEIANGVEKISGFKVDIWSSGVTLFNFVTGEYPFEGDTIFRLFENIGGGEFVFPAGSSIDTLLESLIRGMLNKSMDERFSLKQVREHDWCRKKYPCLEPPVTVTPRDDDPSLSTTVIPYLFNLHFDSTEDDADDHDADVITEHDFKILQQQQQLAIAKPTSSSEVRPRTRRSSDRDKSSRCIKVKKLSGCTVS